MGWESDQENLPEKEPRDWGKIAWVAIFGVFVAMIIALFSQPDESVGVSRVFVKHILVQAVHSDPASVEAAMEKIGLAQAALEAGENFTDVAKEFSDDPDTKDRGGTIGWVIREELTSPIDEHIWTAQFGVVSEPISTQFGFHLVLVTERQIADTELYERELQERVGSQGVE